MTPNYITVTIKLILFDVIQLKQKYADMIESLPFKIQVEETVWQLPTAVAQRLLGVLKTLK